MGKPSRAGTALLLCLFALASIGVTAFAQKTQPSTPAEGLIKLDVVVTDKSGRSIPNLKPEDFTLFDNEQPQPIVSFQEFNPHNSNGATLKSDPPTEVILVIDTFNLQHDQVSLAKSEAERFLRRNNGHLDQPVSLYLISSFSTSSIPRLSSTPTPSTDGNALADAIARGGDLPVVPKIHLSSSDTDEGRSFKTYVTGRPHRNPYIRQLGYIVLQERRRPGRKLLFWLSPGWPAREWPTGDVDVAFNDVTELSTRLREARISLWTWPYPSRNDDYQGFLAPLRSADKVQPGHLELNVLAMQSGGGLLDTSSSLAEMIRNCIERESTFYTLTFDPPLTNHEDDYRGLNVAISKPDFIAHTSAGYYNQPVYNDHPSAARPVTVEQLEQILETAHSSSDKELAQELSGLELTERMNSTRLSSAKARMPGEKSRAALVAIADKSVFLALPPADIPSTSPPDPAERKLILSRTIDYLNKAIFKLPNFFATRTTVQYDEPPQKNQQEWKSVSSDQSLHVTETGETTVTFRNGKEVVDAGTRKGKKLNARERQLDTQGTFGPILGDDLRRCSFATQPIYLEPLGEGPQRSASCLPLQNPTRRLSFRSRFLLPRRSRRNHPLRKKSGVSRRGCDRSSHRHRCSPDRRCRPAAKAAHAELRHHGRVRSRDHRWQNLYLPHQKRLHSKAADRETCRRMGRQLRSVRTLRNNPE